MSNYDRDPVGGIVLLTEDVVRLTKEIIRMTEETMRIQQDLAITHRLCRRRAAKLLAVLEGRIDVTKDEMVPLRDWVSSHPELIPRRGIFRDRDVETPPGNHLLTEKSPMTSTEIRQIAQVAYEIVRYYHDIMSLDKRPPWNHAAKWERDTAIHGVEFLLDHPHATFSDIHDNWVEEKIQDGWRYGATRDPEAKTHPCLMPFRDLPPEQQYKDVIFWTVVKLISEDL